MTDDARATLEQRILVLAPTGKDAALTRVIFEQAGLACFCCSDLHQICVELEAGGGAVLLAEEILGGDRHGVLVEWLARQPPWSDLAVLVLARPGADSTAVALAMDLLGNVTVLERPMRVAALVSAVRTALRGRQRQYQIREHLAERERGEAVLRANDRRKDEFLAILAHELRNPLAPIRNSLHILRLSGKHDPGIAAISEIMDRQVSHMVRLIDDLLEVSRITRGKVELRRERVDVASVIRASVEVSRPMIDAAGHQLVLDIPPASLILDADPVRLAQVFANLLNNSAKYTNVGGRISLTVREEGSQVAVAVVDTGIGIPAEMLPLVFDLFMQLDHAPDRAQGGLGIGLTLVKRLVELHGGTVEVSSEGRGKGSRFVVRLPLVVNVGETAATIPEHPPIGSLVAHSVLVVDDNRDAADSLGKLLRMLGVEVRVVYSGAEALDALPTFRPAAVLLDIGMPGMDGHEVARRIRRLPDFQDVMLVALTGWGQEDDIRRTEAAGFDHHLIKPADVAALQALLSSLEVIPRGRRGRS